MSMFYSWVQLLNVNMTCELVIYRAFFKDSKLFIKNLLLLGKFILFSMTKKSSTYIFLLKLNDSDYLQACFL